MATSEDIPSIEALEARMATLSIDVQMQLKDMQRKVESAESFCEILSERCMEREAAMQERVAALEEELARCKARMSRGIEGGKSRKKKVPEPKQYDGARDARQIDNFFWHMERYFNALDIEDEDEMVETATMYLTDTAALWWRQRFMGRGARPVEAWDEFKRELKRQFYPESVEDLAMINLRRLKQRGSIREYVKEYSTLMLEIQEMPERQRLCFFIDGLQPWVATELRRREPRDLSSAMAIAERLEDYKKEDHAKSPKKDRGFGRGDSHHRKANTTKGSDGESSGDDRRHRRDKGKEHKEWSKPKDKGRHYDKEKRELKCFICEGPHMARDCPQRKAFNAMVRTEGKEGDLPKGKGKKVKSDSSSSSDDESPYMGAMQVLSSIAKKGKTKRFSGVRYVDVEVGGEKLAALVDTGATHNFVRPEIVEKLKLPTKKTGGWIKAVNSDEVKLQRVCKDVEIGMAGWKGKADFQVIGMDDHDMVIGLDFMEKNNAAPIPCLGAMMVLGGEGQKGSMVPFIGKEKSPSVAVNTLELTRNDGLSDVARTVGPRTYAQVLQTCARLGQLKT